MCDQPDQHRGKEHGEEGRDDRDPRGLHSENVDGIRDPRDRGIILIQAAGDVERQVLKQIADADGGDHDGHSGGGAQRFVGHSLDGEAQKHGEKDHQRNRDVQGQRCRQVHHHQSGYHEDVAVGEVDQAENAVDHGIADGDQRILSADGDSRDDIGKYGLSETHLVSP